MVWKATINHPSEYDQLSNFVKNSGYIPVLGIVYTTVELDDGETFRTEGLISLGRCVSIKLTDDTIYVDLSCDGNIHDFCDFKVENKVVNCVLKVVDNNDQPLYNTKTI